MDVTACERLVAWHACSTVRKHLEAGTLHTPSVTLRLKELWDLDASPDHLVPDVWSTSHTYVVSPDPLPRVVTTDLAVEMHAALLRYLDGPPRHDALDIDVAQLARTLPAGEAGLGAARLR